MIILTIHLLIFLGTLLVRENIEGTVWFDFKIRYADVAKGGGWRCDYTSCNLDFILLWNIVLMPSVLHVVLSLSIV